MRHLRLATRGSPLALWQARWVARGLRQAHPGLQIELVIVVSSGDMDRTTPLYGMGNVGIFAKEVHAAVLDGKADAGVHSCKDLPTATPDGLRIAAVLQRADPRDAFIGATSVHALPAGAVIGTSSLRRQAQLSALRPDLTFKTIRGNVGTRLEKVRNGEYHATLMAMAGLHRLGLIRQAAAVPLDPITECTPAPAQGAVAIDVRSDDNETAYRIGALHHQPTATAITIERDVLAGLRGGCSLPFGCYVRRLANGQWLLDARLADDQVAKDQGGLRRVQMCGYQDTLAARALAELTK